MAPSTAALQLVARLSTYSTRGSRLSCTCIPLRPSLSLSQLPAFRPSSIQTSIRFASTETPQATPEPPDFLSEGELKIFNIIKEELKPIKLEVQDVSGGCGSMYALDIVSDQFKGLNVMKQHRLVNKILGEEIKKWHGVQLKTKAP